MINSRAKSTKGRAPNEVKSPVLAVIKEKYRSLLTLLVAVATDIRKTTRNSDSIFKNKDNVSCTPPAVDIEATYACEPICITSRAYPEINEGCDGL